MLRNFYCVQGITGLTEKIVNLTSTGTWANLEDSGESTHFEDFFNKPGFTAA